MNGNVTLKNDFGDQGERAPAHPQCSCEDYPWMGEPTCPVHGIDAQRKGKLGD